MAVITLHYDGRSKIIQGLINSMLEHGAKRMDMPVTAVKETTDELSGYDRTLAAIEEIDNGGGIVCESFEDYLVKAYK